MKNAAVLLAVFAATGAAPAQQNPQAPTPIPQSVVVPSLPDQKNKEGVVRPGATQQTDSGGWVQTNMDPNAVKPATTSSAAPPANAGSTAAPGPGIAPAMPTPGTGSRGPTVIDAANLTVRGTVKAYDKGVSITVREANGKARTVPLAEKTSVYDGLAIGDKVAVRIPLQKPADGKHADRIERQKPPKAAPASKFSQAQTPKS